MEYRSPAGGCIKQNGDLFVGHGYCCCPSGWFVNGSSIQPCSSIVRVNWCALPWCNRAGVYVCARLHREGRGFETLSAHHAAAIVFLISGGSCSVAALQHFAANWALARHGHELTMKL